MALKPLTKLIVVLIVIIAGIAVTMSARSRFQRQRQADQNRFVGTYLAMSIAKQKYIGESDSLRAALQDIFANYGTDSTWMADYGKKLAIDLVRTKQVWAEITKRLEALRKDPDSDSLLVSRQYRPQKLIK
jgi:hypothetical protein